MFGKIKDVLSLDKLIENFEGYLDARIELVKYDLKELMVSILTRSLIFLAMAVFGLAGLLCLNIVAMVAVGNFTNSLNQVDGQVAMTRLMSTSNNDALSSYKVHVASKGFTSAEIE